MNFSELSDFEINKLVAEALGDYTPVPEGCESEVLGSVECYYGKTIGIFQCHNDYCNNPNDAWPIILDNRIDLTALKCEPKTWLASNGDFYFRDENPLRAAMIVYLQLHKDKQ